MTKQIYATKTEMAQTFEKGKRQPLTVLTVAPHLVIASKTLEKDGYVATILGIGNQKKANKPLSGFLKKSGFGTVPKLIKEVSSEIQSYNLSEILLPGSSINVTALSKGKGTSGVMKRWGMHGGSRTHGQSDRSRAPGSIARGTTPGRVVKGKHMAGHMGADNVTVKNLKIHSFDSQTGILQVIGSIPGARGAITKITII